jgi:hypothetical protein
MTCDTPHRPTPTIDVALQPDATRIWPADGVSFSESEQVPFAAEPEIDRENPTWSTKLY